MNIAARNKKLHSLIEWTKTLVKEGSINLTQGVPDFPPPPGLLDAVKKRMDEPWVSKYGPAAGLPELRQLITQQLNQEGVPVEDTIITSGAAEGCFVTLMALVDPGDEVVLLSPYYAKHNSILHIAGVKPIYSPYTKTSEDFRFDISALERSITRRTRMIIVNSPANPTGAVLTQQDLKGILQIAKENNVWVMYDEAYKTMVFDGHHYNKEIYDPNHTVMINSFSKIYALSGWRIGAVSGSKELLKSMGEIHNSLVICPPTISQLAAIEAIKLNPTSYIRENTRKLAERRDLVMKRAKEIPSLRVYNPHGGFFAMLEPKDCKNDVKLIEDIANKAGVVMVPGTDFGAVGMLRLSFGSAGLPQIEEAFNRLKEYFLNKYPKFLKEREKPY